MIPVDMPKIKWFFEPLNKESEEMMNLSVEKGQDFFSNASIHLTKERWIVINLSWEFTHIDYKGSAYVNGHISSAEEVDVMVYFRGIMCPVHYDDGTVDLDCEAGFHTGIKYVGDDLECLEYSFMFFDRCSRGGSLYFAPTGSLMEDFNMTKAIEMHNALD